MTVTGMSSFLFLAFVGLGAFIGALAFAFGGLSALVGGSFAISFGLALGLALRLRSAG